MTCLDGTLDKCTPFTVAATGIRAFAVTPHDPGVGALALGLTQRHVGLRQEFACRLPLVGHAAGVRDIRRGELGSAVQGGHRTDYDTGQITQPLFAHTLEQDGEIGTGKMCQGRPRLLVDYRRHGLAGVGQQAVAGGVAMCLVEALEVFQLQQ